MGKKLSCDNGNDALQEVVDDKDWILEDFKLSIKSAVSSFPILHM